MNMNESLEFTITHKLSNQTEIKELFEKGWVALDFGRKGPDLKAYTGRGARHAVGLFHKIQEQGASVIAAYKGATRNRAERLLGT